jgi:hypothetical protein
LCGQLQPAHQPGVGHQSVGVCRLEQSGVYLTCSQFAARNKLVQAEAGPVQGMVADTLWRLG